MMHTVMKMTYKDKNGTWYVVTQYTEWTGERKSKCKRGFATKREALNWETKFHQQSMGDLDMAFAAFVEIYYKDMKARLKESTWQTKENIIEQKILPYFGTRKINEITTRDVRAWQTEMLAYFYELALSILPLVRKKPSRSLALLTALSA